MLHVEKRFGDVVISVSGESVLEVFKLFAQAEDVFGNTVCGVCKSGRVRFQARKVRLENPVREFDAYEARCQDCGAVLPFGVHADGSGLFCRQYVEEGGTRDYSTRGWRKIQAEPAQASEEADGAEEAGEAEGTAEAVGGRAKLLVGTVMDVERTTGEPYPWEIEFLPSGKRQGEELVLPYFGRELPMYVRAGARVKLAVVVGKSGKYIQKFLGGVRAQRGE